MVYNGLHPRKRRKMSQDPVETRNEATTGTTEAAGEAADIPQI